MELRSTQFIDSPLRVRGEEGGRVASNLSNLPWPLLGKEGNPSAHCSLAPSQLVHWQLVEALFARRSALSKAGGALIGSSAARLLVQAVEFRAQIRVAQARHRRLELLE